MRYAIFTDIHANLEALESVLAQIDELAQQEPIDQIWFLGDLVGYGPNPNECIEKLRERTNVIIAGNHDWAAVGKLDLEDFSEAARISAEWTAEQLTEEHRQFLRDLPERLEIGTCTLVHGSPYGPLWEYLTSEVLAERSFQYFNSRYCFVGHTHVPIIFQQPDTISNTPTLPLDNGQINGLLPSDNNALESADERDGDFDDDSTTVLAAVHPQQTLKDATENTPAATSPLQQTIADVTDEVVKQKQLQADDAPDIDAHASNGSVSDTPAEPAASDATAVTTTSDTIDATNNQEDDTTPEDAILSAEDRLNQEIEELLTLLGLSQSMVNVTNEMLFPPDGTWQPPTGFRAIVNPGGVGQPRDGDSRAAFMIYDTEQEDITFYRVPYPFEKTQEKIIKTGLPRYLATRLAYGR